eukprot:TRINITY_DN45059_c0_g1_i1.p1 TRINITY_DN45059_c0_g1~~TRINITY_DN45059_c0_g1_i1.p1  ORF type:complete len:366 (+),score=56.35 TRINITY_DN45059_c0_g1_i1:65-1162(+)
MKESARQNSISQQPSFIRATDLGAIHLQDNSFEDGDWGILNASAVRRYKAVARPLEAGEPLNHEQPMPWQEELVACIFLFIVFGSFLWVPALLVMGLLMVRARWLCLISVTVAIVARLLPWSMEPPLRFPPWLRLILYRYFSLVLIMPREDQFDKNRTYIFAGAPHGVIPLGDFLSFLLAPLGYIMGLGAPAVLNLPLIGNMLGCTGIVSCARECAARTMQTRSIGLMPGGIAEIFELRSDREAAYLRRRKGFVKLALESGAALVPCYTLGNSSVYDALTNKSLQRLSKALRASVTLFWGRFYLPIPYRRPVCFLMANPIEVPKIEKPSQEDIDKWHQVFCDQMAALFDTHKAAFGWEHKDLVFV